MEEQNCFNAWSILLIIIVTFLTTIILVAVSTYCYRKWRRNKGRHLVLVTRPEIVEDAYAFDNPCFKDAISGCTTIMERPQSVSLVKSPINDSPKWSSPWSLLASGASNKHDNRRTLDDSVLVPTATRVCVVSLRSRDFTGLGFNVCGNMREGIFVKDLLHRGPASESGRIHPGDRIASVKISFRSMVYEDALTILSYASPYDVEIEVESGGTGSRPTTLLKKTVGPSPTRLCHPLYRSQSIPELSRCHKSIPKRLPITNQNETSVNKHNSSMNSTLKSTVSIKSTPDSFTLRKRHDEIQPNHLKMGIKVLPSLDGVHRIVDQNEHNTNLERKNSKNIDKSSSRLDSQKRENNQLLQRSSDENDSDNKRSINTNTEQTEVIVSDVPAEVHNAAMAARRNRKSSCELLEDSEKVSDVPIQIIDNTKSPQKNKKKAPAPPPNITIKNNRNKQDNVDNEDCIESLDDCNDDESSSKYTDKISEIIGENEELKIMNDRKRSDERKVSESESDSDMQHSLTTIELNSADITIHQTSKSSDADNDQSDDMYRKAASLGDLSKYETKNTVLFMERAQSLDMVDNNGFKKKKIIIPSEDIVEISEDLTKLDGLSGSRFDGKKLKKSDKWGTLEDALWETTDDIDTEQPRINQKNNIITVERSKSATEIKPENDSNNIENKILATRRVNDTESLDNNNDDDELGRESERAYVKGVIYSDLKTFEFDSEMKNGIYSKSNGSNIVHRINERPMIKTIKPDRFAKETAPDKSNQNPKSEENKNTVVNISSHTEVKPNSSPADNCEKKDFITEIKVSSTESNSTSSSSRTNEQDVQENSSKHESANVTSSPIKKPPIPPRRSDSTKSPRAADNKQILYVSQIESPNESLEVPGEEIIKKDIVNWNQDSWITNESNQSRSIVTSGDQTQL